MKHWYLFTATYKVVNMNMIMNNIEVCISTRVLPLDEKRVTKEVLLGIRKTIAEDENVDLERVCLSGVSYLGEMTEEEFLGED